MTPRRIHLDPVGGLAGDMFAAAILDAFPEHAAAAVAAVQTLAPPALRLRVAPHRDHVLSGTRFIVEGAEAAGAAHVAFEAIEARLSDATLAPAVRDHACAIFRLLAEAEAAVHGVAPAEVTFHEVGAWDSIADIVCAAALIDALGPARWSVGAIPAGSGRVMSAHGNLPVPAPAVVRLLEGFALYDDGLPGERVTPTGAAILRHLAPAQEPARMPERLAGSGTGFGTRRFEGISNVLRVLVFEAVEPAHAADEIAEFRFAIDDQTPEDLALALDRLRARPGVVDVVQWPGYGKKGRIGAEIALLAMPDHMDATLAAIFDETTTLGVRWRVARRAVLTRETRHHDDGADVVRVKRVRRPSGTVTAKVENDDLVSRGDRAAREARRRRAEDAATCALETDDA